MSTETRKVTTNVERAARVMAQSACAELEQSPEIIEELIPRLIPRAQALSDAGLLASEGMTTQYGVWSKTPAGDEEDISWEKEGARYSDLTQMAINLRKAGWEAERVARPVGPHRFITLSEDPS